MYYMGILFTFNSDKYVNGNRYPRLCFTLREDEHHNKRITVGLVDKDGNDCWQYLDISDYNDWQSYTLGVGEQNQEAWTLGYDTFDWENIKEVRFDFHQNRSQCGVAYVDRLHFGGARWSATEEDSGSQTSYGLRELTETDEELHSDNECSLRGKALLNHLSQPAEFLTLRTTCLDYGNNRLLPGDKIHVTLPNENIDSDFRIITVEYRVTARDQTLEVTLELGKEKPLLADYLYGLRSTTVTVEKLMRTKAGGAGFVAGGGGGGGGGGMVDHGNEWHTPDFSESPHGLADHQSGSARISVGLDADKPAPGTPDRLYFATDTKILYRDIGSAWEEILRGETVTRLAQLSEKAHASLAGIGTDNHHAKLHASSHHKGGADALGCIIVIKFGAEGSTTTSTTYVTIAGSDIALDPSMFKFETTLYMKIIAHIKNDTAGEITYVQIYRQNAGTVVSGSEVSVTGAGWGIVASSWIDWSAEAGNESYQIQMKVTGGTGEYNSVLMILSPVQL
jgi:hypothetical protein